MNKNILTALIFFISLSLFAQGNRQEVEERYRAQKIAFITDKMQLTPEEAQLFWPLYRQMEAEKDALSKEMRDFRTSFPQNDMDFSEEQAAELLSFMNRHSASVSKLLMEFQKKFLKVISAKKLLLLHSADNEFRRHLLQEFRGKNNMRSPK